MSAIGEVNEVLVSASDAFHKNVVVRTTKQAICELILIMKKDKEDFLRHLFVRLSKSIQNANSHELYKKGGVEWRKFMDDILLYYACRFILFNKQMPISTDPQLIEQSRVLDTMGACVKMSENNVSGNSKNELPHEGE